VTITDTEPQHYAWDRLTHPQHHQAGDDRHFYDARGWFSPVHASWSGPGVVDLAPLSALRDRRVIVLMSPSGVGKTQALGDEFALVAAAGRLLNLKRLATGEPVEKLRRLTRRPDEAAGTAWHVGLDGFDEAVKVLPSLVQIIDEWLTELEPEDLGDVRLRMATRPGEHANAGLLEVLCAHFGEDAVEVRALAPLGRDDVAAAAKARLGVPADFVEQLEQRGLASVAGIPRTLIALLNRAAAGQPLPSSTAEAYRQACEELCQQSPGRALPAGLTVPQLMRCAERLAAALQFCHDGVLTADPEAVRGQAVRFIDIADGTQEAPGAPCTTEALEWLSTTALLKPLADGRWQFGHQAFQEFLAAEYLLRREVPDPTLASLLLAGWGPVRHVHPRHRETAGWVAWDRPALLDDVLACDPEVLLGPGLPAQPGPVRAKVVESLVEDGERNAGLSPWRFGGSLHRLDHDGLEEQLLELLKAPAGGDDAAGYMHLSIGLAIAWACPQRVPVDALLALAEDTRLETTARTEAVRALPAPLSTDAVDRLANLAAGLPQQIPEELAQTAQLVLWPMVIGTEQLLRRLTPSYLARSWRDVAARLGEGDIEPVLAWLLEQFSGECTSPEAAFGLLAWVVQRLLPPQGTAPGSPGGAAASAYAAAQLAGVFAELVSHADLAYHSLLHDVRALLATAPPWRRELAGMVVGRVPAGGHAMHFAVHGTTGLFPAEDSAYWAQAVASAPDGELSVLGAPLDLPCPTDPQDLERLERQRATDPILHELTSRWFEPDPVTLQAKLAAEREERRAERRDTIQASLRQLTAERPTSPEEVRTWWRTIFYLLQQADSNPSAPSSDLVDLRTAPSYLAAGSDLQDVLAQCALYALQQAPLVTAATVGAIAVSLSETAVEASALTLVTPPDLSPERWAGLAWALAVSPCRDPLASLRRSLLAKCADAAGDAWTALLPDGLQCLSLLTLQAAAPVLWHMDSDTDSFLLDWLSDPACPFQAWLAAMRGLASHGAPAQIISLLHARSAPPAEHDADAMHVWGQTVDLRLMCGPADELSQVWDDILLSEARTRAWAQAAESWTAPGQGALVHAPVTYWHPAYLVALAPAQAGLLYDRLSRAGMIDPPGPDQPRDIAQGRRALHNRLPDLIAHTLTPQAATELRRLAAAHPDRQHLHTLQQNHARLLTDITPDLPWEQLRTLTAARDRRIVNDTSDLMSVVLEALASLSLQLRDANGWTTLLWQQSASKPAQGKPVERWPLWEDGFSDFLRNFLNNSLADHKVVINREVQVRPAPDAHRGDILIQAPSGDTTIDPLTVVIEVKPCWNNEIQDGLPQQLVAGYLTDHPTWAGIFLCGFFDDPQWTTSKRKNRHTAPKDHTLQGIQAMIEEQARTAMQQGHTIAALVLDCTLPQPSVHGVHRRQNADSDAV